MPSFINDKNLDELKKTETINLYAKTLELQAKVNSSDTISFIKSLPQFNQANYILDAGCGPAAFAYEIKEFFDKKSYIGIDLEPSFIQRAKEKFRNTNNFQFFVSDIHEFEKGLFDVILIYAVLQHVSSPSKTLTYLSSKLKENGSLILLDTREDDSETTTYPIIPVLTKMYSSLHQISNESGRNKDCIMESENWAKENGFRIERKKFTESKPTTIEDKNTFMLYTLYISELLERFYKLKTDQTELISQLTDWSNTQGSYAIITGGTWLVLSR